MTWNLIAQSVSSVFGAFSPPSVTVRVDPMLRMQGYKNLERVRPRVRAVAEQMASLIEAQSRPVVHHRRLRIDAQSRGALSLDAGVTFQCPAFARHLAGCTEVVAFILTLGQSIDDLSRSMTERRAAAGGIVSRSGRLAWHRIGNQEFQRFSQTRGCGTGAAHHSPHGARLHLFNGRRSGYLGTRRAVGVPRSVRRRRAPDPNPGEFGHVAERCLVLDYSVCELSARETNGLPCA